MLEKLVGKKVKILVSSNSGAGSSSCISVGNSMTVVSNIITVFGELKAADEHFVEIKSARVIYLDGFQTGYSTAMGSKEINSSVIDNPTSVINVNNIIMINEIS